MFINKTMTRIVITIKPDAALLEAKALMERYLIRHLPVVEEDNILVGIITDRDVRSAMPSAILAGGEYAKERERVADLKVRDVMKTNPITISPMDTLEDAILLMHKTRKGALPVIDKEGRVTGIISTRDLIRAFINVLGLEEPGTLLCIEVEDKIGQMKKIVDAITEEKRSFGSILVARHWEEGKRAIFPYLLTNNVVKIKKKLKDMGYTLINPMSWSFDHRPKTEQIKRKK